ncbi:MAG: hypothetical protein RL456_992 [Pseudomonadota bacterium]|jgi:hypothetical protein
MGRGARWGIRAAALAVLAAVFLSYLRPSMIVELGNRLWSCF